MRLTPTGFDMGLGARDSWHTRLIGKSPFGTYQKVLEEYDEYLDARAQGLKLVMGFELADMIGALAGCLYADPELRDREWGRTSAEALRKAEPLPAALKRFERAWRSGPRPGPSLVEAGEAAENLLTSILAEGNLRGYTSRDLLSQAQLRSAVLVNGRAPC